jgi:cell wall-associated NlpC family hydrolase
MRLAVSLLLTLLAAGCASTGAVPSPFPRPGPPPDSAGPPAPDLPLPPGDAPLPPIVGTAMSLRGAPYRNGGSDPSGFDCSGFVSYVFAQQGLALPRTVTEQYDAGRGVPADSLTPGDLVFFSTVAPGASHVGIAVSADLFVHAPSSNGVVRVERLSSPYWSARFVGVRRVF